MSREGCRKDALRHGLPYNDGMDDLYITHYYFAGTDPWKNIMNLPEDEAFRMAGELAAAHPDTTSFGRFADFKNYYPRRKAADEYVREKFIAIGGRPELDHPFSFVLLECEYLRKWFSDGESFRISLAEIPDEVISFTVGDSCAQIERGMTPEVFTKQMLLQRIYEHDGSPEKYLEEVLNPFAYVEVQLWTVLK